ncbi:MAG: alpha/beta hydrolase, partial [Planctomycetota bacterium]
MHAMLPSLSRIVATLALALIAGCGVKIEPLMPTPVLYTELGFDPIDHIPESDQVTPRLVYFTTTRARGGSLQEITYSNTPSDDIGVGLALVGFGGQDMSWADLARVSGQSERDEVVELHIAGIIEAGRTPVDAWSSARPTTPDAWLLLNLIDSIENARDQDVLVFVHGAKVNFYNACAFAAQLDHFMGRDMTSVAFSWPTRQDILSYGLGGDRKRAYDAAEGLATVLEVLANETPARRIHVLCWSAGGRVMAEAFRVLRSRHPEESEDALRERLR